ncbi:MAG: ATP-grasp domain-containing protein [Desulfosporosinus sp.]
MMKRLMILGASILQVPAIQKAREMGLYTIAVDYDPNAIGFQYADKNCCISTIDVDAVLAEAIRLKIDGIMTLASDMPMVTVATVATELGLSGIDVETAYKATNKAKMREVLKQANVPIPEFYIVNTYEEYRRAVDRFRFTKKFIVKPADNSGSRGIYMVQSVSEIDKAYKHSKKNSRCGAILVEEYMEGPEVSVETLTINGTTNVLAITDKLTTGFPYFVEMGHSQPTQLNKNVVKNITDVAKAAIKAIGITTGPSHTEIIVTKSGAKIVELGARMGGDNITTYLVPLSTGIDMVKSVIQIAIGEKPKLDRLFHKGSAIRYFETELGTLSGIEGIEVVKSIDDVKQVYFTKRIGDKLGEIYSANDRIGFVIAQAYDTSHAIMSCEKAIDSIRISVTNENYDNYPNSIHSSKSI